jgi:hypothetical protein
MMTLAATFAKRRVFVKTKIKMKKDTFSAPFFFRKKNSSEIADTNFELIFQRF